MAVVRLTFIFLLHCLFVLNINCEGELHEFNDETYRPQIWSFLNYLNSLENRAYNYNYATLFSAEQGTDTTDLIIDVEVNCYKDSDKCITNLLECAGTVKYNSETRQYETLPEFKCAPKVIVDLLPDDDFTDTEKVEAAMHSLDEKTSTDDDSYEVANGGPTRKHLIATKAHCVGCLVELNADAKGINLLTDTALKHIESERIKKQALVRVIRIQSEVVAGVKYILLLEIAPTTCLKTAEPSSCVLDSNANSEICQITYLQQSWISKSKRIIANNCTETQEWAMDDPTPQNSAANDLDNEIDVNYNYKKSTGYPTSDIVDIDNSPNYDSLADTGHADDILKMSGGIMDPSHMKELESQVIYRTPEMDTLPQTESVLTDDQKGALDDLLGMMGDAPREKRSTNDNNNNDSSSSSSSSSEEDDNKDERKKKHHKHDDNNNDDDDDDNNDVNNKEKHSKKKKYHKEEHDNNEENNDTSSSSSSSSSEEEKRPKREVIEQKHKHPQSSSEESIEKAGGHSSSEEHAKKKLKRAVDEKNNNKDSSCSDSSGDEQNNEDNSTKREIANNSSEENTSEGKTTNVPVPKKEASPESDSSEEIKGTVRTKRNIRTNNHLVKITPEEKDFVNNLATFSVNTLDNIDADTQKRVVLQMLGAKKSQQPDGTLYHLTLRVGISRCEEQINLEVDLTKINQNDEDCKDNLLESLTKICKVQVQVNSDKENPKVIKSHCQNMKKDREDSDVNRTFRSKRGGIPGGVSDVDPADPKIKQYAIELLEQLDTQDGNGKQRELVQIISATKQVVQGYRYKLTVELKLGGQSRKCLLDVWDQPWVKKDGKQVSVHCDNETEKKYRFRRSHKQQFLGRDEHDVNIGVFKGFAEMYNKTYSTKTEFKQRFQIFRKNMKMIKVLNEKEEGTAKYGPTKFADLTSVEFKKYLGLNPELYNPNYIPYPNAKIPNIEVPTEFDWRTKGAVSEVKNQGQCGSCWAFSVTGNIEGQNAIKTGKMIELSEQELVDCDKLDEGCNGGLPDNAYRAIEQLGGLETEKDYPYEAEDEKCHFDKSLTRVQISGAVNISTSEEDMVKWLVQNGPISIGINANAMQFYMGGVSHPWKFLCNPTNLDHGVLIVGYGVHKYPLFNKVLPYWIVKNSWGPTWGEQGYYRVFRGDGTCGVNQMASSAVL